MEEAFGLFTDADSGRFWLLEGHWSRGMTPLCVSTANDVLWGTQYGANLYQLPPTKGQAARFSGVHAYASDSPCCSEWEVMQRATRVEHLVGPAIMNFPAMWEARRESITAALAHFEGAGPGIDGARRAPAPTSASSGRSTAGCGRSISS